MDLGFAEQPADVSYLTGSSYFGHNSHCGSLHAFNAALHSTPGVLQLGGPASLHLNISDKGLRDVSGSSLSDQVHIAVMVARST